MLSACSMGEEMRRIEASKQANRLKEAACSTNLTGEQIFVRSCNTCHPGGKQGMGPRLDNLSAHFPSDESLKRLLRTGKGIMPAQPPDTLNDDELDNLLVYLRKLENDLKESGK